MGTYNLNRTEENVLYRKYRLLGLSSDEANFRLAKCKQHLVDLVLRLKSKNKPDNVIQQRFRQEFEKICMELEV